MLIYGLCNAHDITILRANWFLVINKQSMLHVLTDKYLVSACIRPNNICICHLSARCMRIHPISDYPHLIPILIKIH
jgi:hypothetical protein